MKMVKFELSRKEIIYIIKEIECGTDSIRIDDGDRDNVTFDKNHFSEEDYYEYKVEMLRELYVRLKNQVQKM